MQRLRFKRHFHVEVLEPDLVFLLGENGHSVLRGSLFVQLTPYLDGTYTLAEMVNALQGTAPMMQVMHGITHLRKQGYITEEIEGMAPAQAAFWEALGIDSKIAYEKLRERSVSVCALGGVSPEPLLQILNNLGVQVAEQGDLTIVVTDDYLREGLDELNRQHRNSGSAWMLCKPAGTALWVGPIFTPESACWERLANRLSGNREVDVFLMRQKDQSGAYPVSLGVLPASLEVGLNLAAIEAARWLIFGQSEALHNALTTFDLRTFSSQKHTVVKRPQCSVCGDPLYLSQQHPQPFVFQNQLKKFTADGGHRAFSPEQTLSMYEHLISPISGIINSLFRRAIDDLPVQVFGAMHNFALTHSDWDDMRRSLRWRSGGKGITENQARASAMGEALERFSGIMQGYEYREKATLRQLGADALHPNSHLLFSEKQYREREHLNDRNLRFQYVPAPFDEDAVVEWTPLWSLTEQRWKYMPTANCYYNYWPTTRLQDAFAWADLNGTSSGNTYEEAFLQGFMEVVERDAVACWWYSMVQRPRIDIDSFNDPRFKTIQDYYEQIDRDLWAIDITNDLGISTVCVVSRRRDQGNEQICVGYGAHFDPRIALSRALTEASEVLVSFSYQPGENSPSIWTIRT